MMALLIVCCYSTSAEASEEVLLIVHDRKITKGEFLYHFHQNYQEMNQNNIREYLELFIDFHLKLAMAREKRLYHQIGFINELAEFRLLLAAPYLTDQEKIKELAREAMERLKYTVKTNHILIKIPPDANPDDTLKAYNLAVQIRDQIHEAGSFKKIAETLSQDQMIVVNAGDTNDITAFQSEYAYESIAFQMVPDEISKPVKAPSGYYIIHMIEKKKNSSNSKTEQDVITLIKGERKDLLEDAFVARLKKEWNFRENKNLLNLLKELANEDIYKGTWTPPANERFKENLFCIDGKGVSLSDFTEYLQNLDNNGRRLPINDFILNHYEQFVSRRLIQYENFKLPEKYPDFRYQYEEYRDAMLLLQITKQQVWLSASSDSAGLKNFFEDNKTKYIKESEDITLHDVFESVQADYQDLLMNQWVKELRSLYMVELNEKVLSSLLQK